MTKAFVVHTTGGPEKMIWETVTVGKPGPDEVLLRQTVIGVNYVDIHFRSGMFSALPVPFVPGVEGVGIVEDVGANVSEFKVGDRVAYASYPMGAYAESRLMPANRLVHVPDGISDLDAASFMLQGMTACFLVRRTYPVKPGDTILVHAAAGGVGLLVCQWAKALGATVIGTVGSKEKAILAHEHGCDHTIISRNEDIAKRVRELTNGEGVPVVYDSIGKDTLTASLDSLRPLGLLVNFGSSSGPVNILDVNVLGLKGSLFFTRPILPIYTAKRSDLLTIANEFFDVVKQGKVKSVVRQIYSLRDAVQAHRDLEERNTMGSSVLIVD